MNVEDMSYRCGVWRPTEVVVEPRVDA